MSFGRWWMLGAAVLYWSGCGAPDTESPTIGAGRAVDFTADSWARLDPTRRSSTIGSSSSAILPSGSMTNASPTDVVANAFDAIMARRINCGRRPRVCDVDSMAVVGSSLHDRLTRLMNERRAAGIEASKRGSVRHRIDDVELSSDGRARVTTCLTDDTVLMSAGAIFDESVFSAVTVWTMERVDDRWLWVDDDVVRWSRKEDLCGFAT